MACPICDLVNAVKVFWNKAYLLPFITNVMVFVFFISQLYYWVVLEVLWEFLDLRLGCEIEQVHQIHNDEKEAEVRVSSD